jgi:hypothetical protein
MKKPQKAAPEKPVDKLTKAEAKAALADLAGQIAHHSQLYHQKDAPEVSDAAYDALVQRNQAIEARFPSCAAPTARSEKVGAPAASASPRSAIPCPCSPSTMPSRKPMSATSSPASAASWAWARMSPSR